MSYVIIAVCEGAQAPSRSTTPRKGRVEFQKLKMKWVSELIGNISINWDPYKGQLHRKALLMRYNVSDGPAGVCVRMNYIEK